MKENDWTKSICELLQKQDLGNNIYIDVLKKIPYAFEISSFDEDWEIETQNFSKASFETDMVVYEKSNGKIIPRVIIEAKVRIVETAENFV